MGSALRRLAVGAAADICGAYKNAFAARILALPVLAFAGDEADLAAIPMSSRSIWNVWFVLRNMCTKGGA